MNREPNCKLNGHGFNSDGICVYCHTDDGSQTKQEDTPRQEPTFLTAREEFAVEAYKKRLVGGLEELQFSYGSDGNSMLLDAIKLVEETD